MLTFLILEVTGIPDKLTDLEIFVYRSIFWLAMILPFLIEYLVIFQSKCSECFVVACNGRLVAYAILFHQNKLTVLQYLFVAPSFRKQGIGSYLIQSLTQKTHKPLFLWGLPNKVRFYTGLGFVPAKQLFSTKIRHKLKGFGIGYQLLVYDRSHPKINSRTSSKLRLYKIILYQTILFLLAIGLSTYQQHRVNP